MYSATGFSSAQQYLQERFQVRVFYILGGLFDGFFFHFVGIEWHWN